MKYGLVGYSGRMGGEVCETFAQAGHELVLTMDERGERATGTPELLVDFSLPVALPATLRICRQYGVPLVIGATGYSDSEIAEIERLGETQAVVRSANFGIGVTALAMMLEDYTEILADWELEIAEIHHNKKKDAPSGTALLLMAATGRTCPTHSLRLGNLPGDHAVFFSNGDELLTFGHRLVNRRSLSRGALAAALFALHAACGCYTFQDVLRAKMRAEKRTGRTGE